MDVRHLEETLRTALETWHQQRHAISPLTDLQLFQHVLRRESLTPHQATNVVLNDLLESLKMEDREGAALLTRRFLDGEPVQKIIHSLNISESTFHRKRKEAVRQAAILLQTKEKEVRAQHQALLEKRLERATYTELIGFEAHQTRLLESLLRPEPPWLVSIEGIGGIGKTSLAHAISRQVIQEGLFEDFGWVSARSRRFELEGTITEIERPLLSLGELVERLLAQLRPDLSGSDSLSSDEAHQRLKSHLKQSRCLLVIDNLETVEGLAELLPALCDLATPSKILLTSREHFYHDCAMYHFRLPGLSRAGALRLLRHEIALHHLSHMSRAGDTDLDQIYQVVGGNPLALRLVIGQAHIFALTDILAGLLQARSQSVEELYAFIYWRAWNSLNEPTRVLFLAMPLITDEGAGVEEIIQISGLDAAAVQTSLKRLVDLNLVNSIGDHRARRYTIHNLTRTFLQEQILKWT